MVNRIAGLLKAHGAVEFGDFVLSSGKKSNYYMDIKSALTDPGVGCLFASYCYEAQLFDDDILGIIRAAMQHWRDRFGGKLAEVMALHPPRLPVTAESLADLISTVFEGAFIMSRTFGDATLVVEQLAHYRNYLELLFQPAPAA